MTLSKKDWKRKTRALVGSPRLLLPLKKLSRKGYLPFGLWARWPVVGTFGISLPGGGHILYRAMYNRFLDRVYFWRGLDGYEPETFKIFFGLAKEARVVLDVGANSGIYTLLACAANDQCRVISFEPVPKMREQLARNIKINGFAGRCDTRREAVSDTTGSCEIYYPLKDETKASLKNDWGSGGRGCHIEFTLTTIDEACSSEETVDLVKIDVEGLEDKVLKGMQRVLKDFQPSIIVECVPDGPYMAVESILSGFGYHFYHLRRSGPVRVDAIVPDRTRQERNFLCSTREIGTRTVL